MIGWIARLIREKSAGHLRACFAGEWLRGGFSLDWADLLWCCADECGSLNELGVPPCWRAYFFLLRQEKVAKKKATPGYAVGYANSPALLEGPGGLRNSPAAQTTQAEGPRPFSVARRSTWGPERRDGSSSGEIVRRLRSTGENGQK